MNEDKSTRYHRRRRRADAAGTALVGVFLVVLVGSGAAGLFRTAAEWVASWLPWPLAPAAAVALFSAGLAVTVHAIELPFAWYQGYWLERRYGLSTQILPHWLADHVKAAVASCAVMVAGLSAVYLSMRWAPELWWAVSAALFMVAMVGLARLAPVVLLPIFYRVRPLDRPELSDRLLRLAARAGAPVIGAYEWALSGHTRKANAALAGIGRSRRILISDTMLDAYSEDEIEVVLAHELSHHVHHDLWRGMAMQAATIVVGFYVAAGVLTRAVPWLGLRGTVGCRRRAAAAAGRRDLLVRDAADRQCHVAGAGTPRRPLRAAPDPQPVGLRHRDAAAGAAEPGRGAAVAAGPLAVLLAPADARADRSGPGLDRRRQPVTGACDPARQEVRRGNAR